ncbi:MAG: hypothetical protein KTR31_19395 [Myxococcales bacterium]|nr:hypothetical protein [Myxococcales bacterium]
MRGAWIGVLGALACGGVEDVEPVTGFDLRLEFYGDADIAGFHLELIRSACDPRDPAAPIPAPANVDLAGGTMPEHVQMLSQTIDLSNEHVVTELRISPVRSACYDILVAPAREMDGDRWEPSLQCSAKTAPRVESRTGKFTPISFDIQCVGDPAGFDTALDGNEFPVFELDAVPTSAVQCEPVRVCATVWDPDDDAVEMVWEVDGDPFALQPADLQLVGFENGRRTWQACADVVPDEPGEIVVEPRVYDLGWQDGTYGRVEDWLSPGASSFFERIAITSDYRDDPVCWNDQGALVYEEGYTPAAVHPGCEPSTPADRICPGGPDDDPMSHPLCFGSYLRGELLYPACEGDDPPDVAPVQSLAGQAVPPVDLSDFVADEDSLVVLGKALFWDVQVGFDQQACASCHFQAGVDSRLKNQVSPGLRDEVDQDFTFARMAAGQGGPNYTLHPDDFPLYQLRDPSDRNSEVVHDAGNDVVSSAGTRRGDVFVLLDGTETCSWAPDDVFALDGNNTRRVEERHAPSTINAVFNFRNLWDGRAANHFNGIDPLGRRSDAGRRILRAVDGGLELVDVDIANAPLAGVATGPVLSILEMNCGTEEREADFPRVARRLLDERPLALQEVHPDDSVLGSLRSAGGGLGVTYAELVRRAFQRQWWEPSLNTPDGFTLMEGNFTLFHGLAVNAYLSTLVSDDTPYDRFADGDTAAMTDEEIHGLGIFLSKGQCISCHGGPELTHAASPAFAAHERGTLVRRTPIATTDGGTPVALRDVGFDNIGVTPTSEDLGVGGEEPPGVPISFVAQEKARMSGGRATDDFEVDASRLQVDPGTPVSAFERDAVSGAFKIPSLRNVALTGPYFHNGGQATLEQVVDFFDRGGDRRNAPGEGFEEGCDSSGWAEHCSHVAPGIEPLGLSLVEKRQLLAFLRALTDERVRDESGVFDHPSLPLSVGHSGDEEQAANADGICLDDMVVMPAVGSGGRTHDGLPMLPTFEDLLMCVDGDPEAVLQCYREHYGAQ